MTPSRCQELRDARIRAEKTLLDVRRTTVEGLLSTAQRRCVEDGRLSKAQIVGTTAEFQGVRHDSWSDAAKVVYGVAATMRGDACRSATETLIAAAEAEREAYAQLGQRTTRMFEATQINERVKAALVEVEKHPTHKDSSFAGASEALESAQLLKLSAACLLDEEMRMAVGAAAAEVETYARLRNTLEASREELALHLFEHGLTRRCRMFSDEHEKIQQLVHEKMEKAVASVNTTLKSF